MLLFGSSWRKSLRGRGLSICIGFYFKHMQKCNLVDHNNMVETFNGFIMNATTVGYSFNAEDNIQVCY